MRRRWFLAAVAAPLIGLSGAVLTATASTDAGAPPRPPVTAFPPDATLPSTTTTTLAVQPPTLTRQVEYYDIAGRSADELGKAMTAKGLVDGSDNTIGDAQTSWTISWSFAAGRFDPRSIEVVATSIVTLPRWTPPPGADRRLVRRWERFIAALTEHEQKHVAIVEACAQRLPAAVAAATTRLEGNAAAEAVVEQCKRENSDFDVRTDHGAKEGVIL